MISLNSKFISSRLGQTVSVAAVYYLVAKCCLLLAHETTNVTAIWPPTGIALAAVLLCGCRIWPAIALGAFFANLDTFIALNFSTRFALAGALSTAIGNTLGALASGFLILRFASGQNPFRSTRGITIFVLFGALIGTNVSALTGAGTLTILHGMRGGFFVTWLTWWLGDAVAVLIITPLFMTWEMRLKSFWTARRMMEAAVIMLLLLVVGWVVFLRGATLPYLFIPILIWSAFRFGKFESACLILLILSLSIWGSVEGVFTYHNVSPVYSLLLTQVFISIASVMTMILNSLIGERDAASEDLRRSYENLQQEIAVRLQAEESLRKSEERFQLFMRHFPGLAYIKDYRSRILFANRGFLVHLGIDPSEVIGKTDRDIVPAEVAEKIIADDRYVMGTELADEDVEYEEVFAGRTWLTRKFAIPVADKEPMLGGITIDVSEQKRAEEEKTKLAARNRQLQKAESLGRMAGAIAHHFNNQLTGVIGNLEMAMLKIPPETETVRNLDRALQAARRASEVSVLMLTYLGQTPGLREPMDLSEACGQILPMLGTISKDLVIEADLPLPGPVIIANPNKIQLLLMNLVTNAWESLGDAKSVVFLAVKSATPQDIPEAHRFPVGWKPKEQGYACLEVADSGCGIAAENMEKIFDPFYSTKSVGRGMGLCAVLGILRSHDGVATVESKEGQGSVFRVFLPLSKKRIASSR